MAVDVPRRRMFMLLRLPLLEVDDEDGLPMMWSEGGGGADTVIEVVDFEVDSLYFSSIAIVQLFSYLSYE